jgi:hypothetical protein
LFAFAFFDHSGAGNRNTTTGTFAKPCTFQIAEVFKVREEKIPQIEAHLYTVPNYRERTDFDQLYEGKTFCRTMGSNVVTRNLTPAAISVGFASAEADGPITTTTSLQQAAEARGHTNLFFPMPSK